MHTEKCTKFTHFSQSEHTHVNQHQTKKQMWPQTLLSCAFQPLLSAHVNFLKGLSLISFSTTL